jgi:hypothetical protein
MMHDRRVSPFFTFVSKYSDKPDIEKRSRLIFSIDKKASKPTNFKHF